MARVFTTSELQAMRAANQSRMMDECKLARPVQAQAADGFVAESVSAEAWEAAVAQPCGLSSKGGRLVDQLAGTPIFSDAGLRLAHDADVAAGDLCRITKRFGVELVEPLQYRVLTPPALGPAGIVVQLQRVQP